MLFKIFVTILRLEIEWKDKVFLCRFFSCYGDQNWIRKSIKGLSSDLGLNDRLITSSVKTLQQEELLICKPVETGGRPTREYSLSKSLLSLLENNCEIELSPLSQIIDSLITRDEKIVEGFPQLSNKNCWVWAVFLFLADGSGVVSNRSMKTISRLMGVSEDQFRCQLKKLKQTKAVWSVVSGISAIELFGKAHSVYFLNLGRLDTLKILAPSKPLMMDLSACNIAKFAFRFGDRKREIKKERLLREIAINHSILLGIFNEDFFQIVRYFREARLERYVQLKCEEYACDLTTEFGFTTLGATELPVEELKVLKKKIGTELFSDNRIENGNQNPSNKFLVDFFLKSALIVHNEVVQKLDDLNMIQTYRENFVGLCSLIPVDNSSRVLITLNT